MKCAACGYEKTNTVYRVNEATFYKSGKNKGKLKGYEYKEIRPDENKEDFIEITLEKDAFEFEKKEDWGRRSCVTLYACPECGTVKIESLW